MAVRTISAIAAQDMSTSAGTFDNAGGWQFSAGSTITIAPGASILQVTIADDDAWFDDDDLNQTVFGDQDFFGTTVPHGTIIESEYVLRVADSTGAEYRLQAVTLNNDAFATHGFVFQGAIPPLGETMTVLDVADVVQSVDAYATAAGYAPVCFTKGTMIATPGGPRAVETLRTGDLVLTLDNGPQPLRLVTCQRRIFPPGLHPWRPVRIGAGELGDGVPASDLGLSPQHRVLVRDDTGGEWLVPAKAVAQTGGRQAERVTYFHLVLDHHGIVLANGLLCETFWPGEQAMASLDESTARQVSAILGSPEPARRFLRPGQARRMGCTFTGLGEGDMIAPEEEWRTLSVVTKQSPKFNGTEVTISQNRC